MNARSKEIHPCDLSGVSRDILVYVSENPDARDTLEGIADWWLLDRQIDRELARVEKALAQLVDAELIKEKRAADGRVHYAVNPDREDAITKVLAGSREDG